MSFLGWHVLGDPGPVDPYPALELAIILIAGDEDSPGLGACTVLLGAASRAVRGARSWAESGGTAGAAAGGCQATAGQKASYVGVCQI